MKKIIGVSFALLFVCIEMAVADSCSWTFVVRASPTNRKPGPTYNDTYLGWMPDSTDSIDYQYQESAYHLPPFPGYASAYAPAFMDDDNGNLVLSAFDYRGIPNTGESKTWNLPVFYLRISTTKTINPIKIGFTMGVNPFPYGTAGNIVVKYTVDRGETWFTNIFNNANPLNTGYTFNIPGYNGANAEINKPDIIITATPDFEGLPVPEPSGLLAIGGGVMGLLIFRRRWK